MRTVALVLLAGAYACQHPSSMPTGYWQSDNGRADIAIVEKEDGKFSAIVYHPIYGGGTCPLEYPIVRTGTGAYIRAEGRIIISFDEKKDVMFLSPGGAYHRKIRQSGGKDVRNRTE